jgi:hypothetical protein
MGRGPGEPSAGGVAAATALMTFQDSRRGHRDAAIR